MQANIGPDGGTVLAFAKLPMIVKAVYDACAGEDGLIEDPGQCQFKPADLACAGADGPDCLTAAEVETLEKWYAGPRNSSGEQIYPGRAARLRALLASLARPGRRAGLARRTKPPSRMSSRYYSFAEDPGPDYDVAAFDFDKDPERMVQSYGDMEASGTDLSKFEARGGKLLIYQGLADADSRPRRRGSGTRR